MIVLRRMHVINWMYYGIQTIELERSNLLSGPTGSGKSSIIDALQVVILGEIAGRYFNRSATGSKSDRTIVTYLRGKYLDSDYKRKDKAFSSYIVVDFYDELHREEFCYGVVFDLTEDDTHEKDFFYIGKNFYHEWAVKGGGNRTSARSRAEFKTEMKTRGIPLKLFSPNDYKHDLLQRLGIYDEHFFQVFRTAVSYVPLDKIEDFIVKNICHAEDNIDVPKMKAAIHEYQRMQRDMADFQERQRELTEIKGIRDEYFNRRETLEIQKYMIARAQLDRLREEQLAAEVEMQRLEHEREHLTREDQRLEEARKQKEDRQSELIKLIETDPEKRRKDELESKLKICSQSINERERQRDNQLLLLGQRLSAWKRRLLEVSESPVSKELDCSELAWLSQTLGSYNQYTKETFANLDPISLSEANSRLEQLRNSVLGMQTSWKKVRNDARRTAEEYRAQLDELKKGVKSYPKDLLALKAYLQSTLSAEHGSTVQVSILADLISITEPVWVNVTEGYFHQKLYLLVASEYYREAVGIVKKYSRENKCYSYRVIHSESILSQNTKVFGNSLARIIKTEHPAARKYVDYQLGRVERVTNIETVSGWRTAVTTDGMTYMGFTSGRINEAYWRMKYIGQESIARQIEETERLLMEVLKQIESLDLIISALQPWVDEKTLSDEFLENLEQAVAGARELTALNAECDSLWAQIQKIDDSYSKQLQREQKQIQRELSELSVQIKTVNQQLGELNTRYNSYYLLSGEKEDAWTEENTKFSAMYPAEDEVAERTFTRYESELRQKGSAEKMLSDFEPALKQTEVRLNALTQEFRHKVETFNYRHTDSSVNTELSSGEWRKAYDEVNSIRLEDYTDQVAAAKKRAEEIFHNTFINEIKRNIDTVKREINLLNRALEEYTFGKIQYRFKCVPTEKAEFRQYYDMITNARLDGANIFDLLEPGTDLSEYRPLAKTLFELIASDGTDLASRQEVEANIEKYKSFQSYLRFDLVEVADGKEYPLSSTMGSKSGGERQTPFYVAILASLMKTYKMSNQNANSLRLVVFDEAFDKIDTSRIEECILMLREIGFQFIIAAPDNKASYIAPLVERTWVVVKPDEMTSVIHQHHKNLEDVI